MHRLLTIALIVACSTYAFAHEQTPPPPAFDPPATYPLAPERERTRTTVSPTAPSYPRLAGFLPAVEETLRRGLQSAGRTDGLIRIGADTNGHLIAASVVFTFPEHGPEAVPSLQAHAVHLARATFQAVPAIDELQLTAFQLDRGYFNAYRSDVSFTAAITRADMAAVRQSAEPIDARMRAFRVWYHPTIRPAADGSTVDVWSRARAHPKAAPYQGGEQATAYLGDVADRFLELRDRLVGHLRGQTIAGKIYRGPVQRRALAVTFDDGPMPIYTTLLLDSLRREGLKATFFVIGQRVRQYPYLTRAIVADGHEIANHTFSHVNLTHLSAEDARDEIARAQRAITAVTGRTAEYFRMPGGQYNRAILEEARRQGLTTVFWTAAPGDHRQTSDAALQRRLMARVYNGGIILLHQGIPGTLRMLPHARGVLQERGYQLTTVSGLMAGAPIQARR